jgi:hypothetical protein
VPKFKVVTGYQSLIFKLCHIYQILPIKMTLHDSRPIVRKHSLLHRSRIAADAARTMRFHPKEQEAAGLRRLFFTAYIGPYHRLLYALVLDFGIDETLVSETVSPPPN